MKRNGRRPSNRISELQTAPALTNAYEARFLEGVDRLRS